MIDEISEHELAAEALQASLNGQLIITTMLAANVIQTVNKLHGLANEKLAPGAAQNLLADGLLGILHLHLSSGPRQKLATEFLFLKDETLTKTVLRNGKYDLTRLRYQAPDGEHDYRYGDSEPISPTEN